MRVCGLFMVLIFAVGFLSQGCIHHRESVVTKKHSPTALKKDAKILSDVVLAMHPAVGVYQPASYYKDLFNDFVSGISDSMTEKEFRLKVKLVLDELHCGHTEVLYSSRFYKEANKMKLNHSPYIFLPVKDRVFMIANINKKQDSTLKRGTEIVRINKVPVDSILRYSRRFISTDGFNLSGKDHYIQLSFNSYYPGLFGRPDTFEIEYKEGQQIKTLRYGALKIKNLPPLPLEHKDDSLFKRFKQAKIKYRYLEPDKKTMVMKIERFTHRNDAMAYRKIFRKLKKNQTENLVLDLRNNGGGSLANSYRLLSYLVDTVSTQTLKAAIRSYPYRKYTRGNIAFKITRIAYKIIGEKRTVNDTDHFVYRIKPRKKNHFDKNIYVLINGGSFSASCLVAAYLKPMKNVTFVGEETGGAREGCNAGITPFYKLPNTGLRVRVPAFRIVHDVYPVITGRGILPDYKTTYTFKDIVTRRDNDILKVKELINQAK